MERRHAPPRPPLRRAFLALLLLCGIVAITVVARVAGYFQSFVDRVQTRTDSQAAP